jgi:hypothetical protein
VRGSFDRPVCNTRLGPVLNGHRGSMTYSSLPMTDDGSRCVHHLRGHQPLCGRDDLRASRLCQGRLAGCKIQARVVGRRRGGCWSGALWSGMGSRDHVPRPIASSSTVPP